MIFDDRQKIPDSHASLVRPGAWPFYLACDRARIDNPALANANCKPAESEPAAILLAHASGLK